MKQLYQILPIALSIGLFGCGNTSNQQVSAASSEEDIVSRDDFISKLPADAPVVKVAVTGSSPPFTFQDDYGNMQGTDIDSIRAIGEEQGFKVEFYKEGAQNLFDSVESGERDLALSGIAYSDERASRYGLSAPYYSNPGALAYAAYTLDVKSLKDLTGLRVGVLEGTTKESLLKEMEGIELVPALTSFISYQRLARNEIDVVVDDLPTLQYTAANHPEFSVSIKPYENENEVTAQQVMVMAKNDKQLINTVNEGIAKLKANGTFDEIEKRWLGVAGSEATVGSDTTQQVN